MRHAACLAAALVVSTTLHAAPTDLAIDPDRTVPRFTIERFGFASLQGYFVESDGRVVVDDAAGTAAIDLAIRTASLRLGKGGAAAREHGRDGKQGDDVPAFLEAEAHPVMTLKAKALPLDRTLDRAAEAEFTFRGVTRAVALKVVDWRCDPGAADRAGCVAVATAQVRRSDFGMTIGYPFVGDDVSLRFELAARRR